MRIFHIYFSRFSHNWWHVSVCYLEGHAPLEKVLHVYDYGIMKGLDKKDDTPEYEAVRELFKIN